jgi:hypothetical protein
MVVWLMEVLVEALLLGVLLGILVSSQIGLFNGVIASVLAVPVILFLHWYYITRAFFGVVWRSQTPWLYPAIAAALFVAHMYVALARAKSDLSSFAQAMEPPFLAGGACIVFACAFGGNWLLRKWTRTASSGPDTLHRGVVPGSAGG